MKYLYLMGASGSGKTRLAMNLEEFDPEEYNRVVELSTREIRENEINGYDYKFVTDQEFNNLRSGLFETVEYQFAPSKYGAEYSELEPYKWNVVVVSIEGFFSSVINNNEWDKDTKHVLVNILNDCDRDIEREGRSPELEEKFNKAAIMPFKGWNYLSINDHIVDYKELKLSELKEIRNDKDKLISKFDELLGKEKENREEDKSKKVKTNKRKKKQ